MGFSEHAQNIISQGIYLAGNQNHNFGSWWRSTFTLLQQTWHQFTQRKKDTQKDCDRSHESEVYFFRVLLTLELLLLNITFAMAISHVSCCSLLEWLKDEFFPFLFHIWPELPSNRNVLEGEQGSLKDQIAMPLKTFFNPLSFTLLFTRRNKGFKGKGRKTT